MLNRWRHVSLRARMTAAASAVALLVLAASGAVIIWRVQVSLVGEVDALIIREAAAVVAAVSGSDHVTIPQGIPAGTAVQVLTASGSVVASSPDLAGEPRLFRFTPSPTATIPVARTVRDVPLGGEGLFRVVGMSTTGGDGATYDVYVAAPLGGVGASVTTLGTAFAIALPTLELLFAVLAWVFVGRALRPVERLRAEAARISASDLHRRVSVPVTHDELARLASTLNDLLTRLDRSVSRQRDFVADAAHELRSPIASIVAQLEVARHTGSPIGTEQAGGLLQEARRLAGLGDDLLTLARLDAHPVPAAREVDLEDIVGNEVDLVRPRATVAVSIAQLDAARVTGDPQLLSRVTRNLLDNAIRYARQQVTVSLVRSDGWVTLEVSDDGPGVPEEDRELVFDRFTRRDASRSRGHGGAGLGLAIARDAVRAHGGTIELLDAGPGARLRVRLPVTTLVNGPNTTAG